MPSLSWLLIAVCVLLVIAPQGAFAFGAGNIPSYAYLEGIAFRHGDIEDVLAELLKQSGSGLLSVGRNFGGLDIKRVYFGNWLRDYSQAVDVAMLKQTTMQNIMNIVTVLGFLAHGYATEEFQVTEERLGIYLPIEHIDNPRGYPDNAQQFHPKLRGPVDPRELEIDLRTGMKNYIANEHGTWDTSTALVRRTLEKCIGYGRQYRSSNNKPDSYEAYRLLGTALHTLEDFSAHSNFCELALVRLGHAEVFTHVGDSVRLRAPNGKMVPPLVTGTFGGDDFMHSLLGEASDHITQTSISELNTTVNNAKNKQKEGAGANQVKALLSKIPTSGDGNMGADVDKMTAPPQKNPETMDPRELYANIWRILTIRDGLVKKIEKGIEKIPGLGPLLEELMNSIAVIVFTTLEPYLKPLMQNATKQLSTASGDVIKGHDQEECFRDPYASDPTHSYLSKDHFNLILNEPAGHIARIIVTYTVKAIVNAWENPNIPVHQVTEPILECMFHPDFQNPNSRIQREMLDYMQKWISSHSTGPHSVIQRLTKESVRMHRNVRNKGDQNYASTSGQATGSHGPSHTSDFAIPGVVIPGMGGSAHSSSAGPSAFDLISKIPGLEGAAKVDQMFQQLGLGESEKPHKKQKEEKEHKEKKEKKDKDKDKDKEKKEKKDKDKDKKDKKDKHGYEHSQQSYEQDNTHQYPGAYRDYETGSSSAPYGAQTGTHEGSSYGHIPPSGPPGHHYGSSIPAAPSFSTPGAPGQCGGRYSPAPSGSGYAPSGPGYTPSGPGYNPPGSGYNPPGSGYAPSYSRPPGPPPGGVHGGPPPFPPASHGAPHQYGDHPPHGAPHQYGDHPPHGEQHQYGGRPPQFPGAPGGYGNSGSGW